MSFLRRLFQSDQPHPLDDAPASPASMPVGSLQTPDPVRPKVLAIIHNPTIRPRGGQKAQVAYRWNDPDQLAQGYISDLREVSGGYLDYQIAERIEVDGFPVKQDGYRYTDESFDRAWNSRQFHQPDAVDYLALVREFRMIEKVNTGAIDEVWLLGFPYCGYYESIMAGPGAFWCNAPPLGGTQAAKKRFVIMGFNYERGVGEMLEDMGHRAESMLSKVFERAHGDANLWERFTRYDKTHPGRAECGNVHFAPNSLRDYDWGNPRPVPSRCDNWYHFPDLSGEPRQVTCSEWGNGDIRRHHVWWMRHFPHFVGATNNISWNWWEYIVDPNRVA
ncbi:MAG TPA: hypothetical protein VHD90_02285 [Phototrophicaceae bacterium]|nr:hypothetical protein [Phototrophicaceae bacterium]